MFFKLFLFAIFMANVSSSAIAEKDYYKQYHSDDYDDDYEYQNDSDNNDINDVDDTPDEVTDKPTDGTTKISGTTFIKVESDEVDQLTKDEPLNPALRKKHEKTIQSTETQTSETTSQKIDDDNNGNFTNVKHFNPLLLRHYNYKKSEEPAEITHTSEPTSHKVENDEADLLPNDEHLNPLLVRNYENTQEPTGIIGTSEATSEKTATDETNYPIKVKHFSPLPNRHKTNTRGSTAMFDESIKDIDSETTEKLTKIQRFNPLPVKHIPDITYIISPKPETDVSTSNTKNKDEITFILRESPEKQNKLSAAKYEVTEKVDDIPNIMTFRPIVTNFTIKLPLNNATGINNTIKENIESNKPGQINKANNLRKNTISIFHVNAEFDDDKDKKPVIQNINIHKIPFGISTVKNHIHKIKHDVLNYVHSAEASGEIEEGHVLPNFFSAPGNFVSKLLEKGSALYHRYF